MGNPRLRFDLWTLIGPFVNGSLKKYPKYRITLPQVITPSFGARKCHDMIREMAAKPKQKPPLTDAERHKRFVEMAEQVGASDDAKAFDKAFKKVAAPRKAKPRER
jgi:hypothetical protein